jgi:hypothetical protein
MDSTIISYDEAYKLQMVWNEYVKTLNYDHLPSEKVFDCFCEDVFKFLNNCGLTSNSDKNPAGFTKLGKTSYLVIIDYKKWMLARIKYEI